MHENARRKFIVPYNFLTCNKICMFGHSDFHNARHHILLVFRLNKAMLKPSDT
jgi:hypothetical protein